MTHQEMTDKLHRITRELNDIQNQLDREGNSELADTLERVFSPLAETKQTVLEISHSEALRN